MSFSCTEVSEYLPWLLNGSLQGDPLQLVLKHLEDCEECREELEETHRARVLYDTHPPAQELALLVLGAETISLDRELVQSHLDNCSACQSEVEMIRAEACEPTMTVDRTVLVSDLWARPRRAIHRTSGRAFWRVAAVLALLVGSILVGREVGRQPESTSAPAVGESGRIAQQGFEQGFIVQQAAQGGVQVMVFADGFETGDVQDWPEDPQQN